MKKLIHILFMLSAAFFMNALFVFSSFSQISISPFATGLSNITDIKNAGDDRLFVVEEIGRIKIVDKSGNVNPVPFFNIQSQVVSGGEQGLLGLAFSPDYVNDKRFYVYYTGFGGHTHISRFKVSSLNPDSAEASSEELLVYVTQPFVNHNGGCLQFGNDGYLYCALGDGGSGGDPGNRAQNLKDTLGKILRIDVSPANGYAIPADNPFVNDTSANDLIWCYGLRNPWRFSFDRTKNNMWIGDVGQGNWEEVNFQTAQSTGGENYGWRCYEGNHVFNTGGCSVQSNYVFPVYEYMHSITNGCSVTGGYVYRGGKFASLFGKYFFMDYCSGILHSLKSDTSSLFVHNMEGNFGDYDFGTFGEDRYGEIYLGGFTSGTVYKLKDADCTPTAYLYDKDTLHVCGDTVVLSTPLNDSLQYQWYYNGSLVSGVSSNEFSVTQNGWYRVRVASINNSCSNTSSDVYVRLSGLENINFTGLPSFICKNHLPANLSGTPGGGTFSGEGILENSFNPEFILSGNYQITYSYVTNYGCTIEKKQNIVVTDCINDTPFIIAPNPTANNLIVNFSFEKNEDAEISIYDAAGKICFRENILIVSGSTQHAFNIPNLSSGVYTLQLKNSTLLINGKFVIAKAK